MTITLIGIDCATDPARIGLALGVFDGQVARILETEPRPPAQQVPEYIREWLPAHEPALLAIDAPLGWPDPLGKALLGHQAGMPIKDKAHNLFRRTTDVVVKEQTDQQSLDVGADRIARTAHAALCLLHKLRPQPETPIPLAWSPTLTEGLSAIEVYPAATLKMHNLPSKGYKARDQVDVRSAIITGLRDRLVLPDTTPSLIRNADALDAVVCILAAVDFLTGQALAPREEDLPLAKKEGWIWVRTIQQYNE